MPINVIILSVRRKINPTTQANATCKNDESPDSEWKKKRGFKQVHISRELFEFGLDCLTP